ncbi:MULTISPECIES: hypothetical protein [unclassified Frankia]|uniref:hypothetical protein n=1 Tax=unclassified Frankia TaxID=2632575 RepID=UPI002AD3DC69|nr:MULTISPECIES: hypothetical protein [unclassified Frankia]
MTGGVDVTPLAGGGETGTASLPHRRYVIGLLERDAAYAKNPKGEPPLSLRNYWRALVDTDHTFRSSPLNISRIFVGCAGHA